MRYIICEEKDGSWVACYMKTRISSRGSSKAEVLANLRAAAGLCCVLFKDNA